jgi:cytoskeletal protein RodZ
MITSNKHISRLRLPILLGIILVIAGVVAALELTNTTHIFHKKTTQVISGSSYSNKGEVKNNQSKSDKNSSSSTKSSQPSDSAKSPTTTAELVAPSGTFVSNHRPNLSGSPAPNTIASVCNSTPGAKCTITFTQKGVTKSLPEKTIDDNGSVYWSWQLQDIGISTGTWKIQAIATLNGQTKITTDSLDLVVSP